MKRRCSSTLINTIYWRIYISSKTLHSLKTLYNIMDIFCLWKAFTCLKMKPHYEESGYFYHVVLSKLVFISSTSEGWTAESTLERTRVDSNWAPLDWYSSNVTTRPLLPVREFIPNKMFITAWVGNHFKHNTLYYQNICSKLNEKFHAIIAKTRWPKTLLKNPHMWSWYPPEIKLQLYFTTDNLSSWKLLSHNKID